MRIAVFTIVHNERYFLPMWINYYSRYFHLNDIYVLDDNSNDKSTENLKVNHVKFNNSYSFDHTFLLNNVKRFQKELLYRYDYVLFAEADEFIATHPKTGLGLKEWIQNCKWQSVRTTSHILFQAENELPIDLNKPILSQRKHAIVGDGKVLLSKVPLNWGYGFHDGFGLKSNEELILFHLRIVDLKLAYQRMQERLIRQDHPTDGCAIYNRKKQTFEEFCNEDYNRPQMFESVTNLTEDFQNLAL